MKNIIRCLALLIAAGLLIGGAYADEPRSYKITLNSVYRVGQTELRPGEYKVVVDGSQKVRLTELKTGKAIDVEAKVESVNSKFDRTAITTKQVDGVSRLSEIQIGGSKTKIAFE